MFLFLYSSSLITLEIPGIPVSDLCHCCQWNSFLEFLEFLEVISVIAVNGIHCTLAVAVNISVMQIPGHDQCDFSAPGICGNL